MKGLTKGSRDVVLERMEAVNEFPTLETLQPFVLTHTHDESPRGEHRTFRCQHSLSS